MSIKLNYFVIPLITLVVMAIGAYITITNMSWYHTLNLPPYVASSTVISWMWRIIYALTTISALIVFNTFKRDNRFYIIMCLFVINALLNVIWTYLFFGQQQIGLAFIEIIALAATIYALIILIWRESRIAASLLFLYAAWVTFAGYLNYMIWMLN